MLYETYQLEKKLLNKAHQTAALWQQSLEPYLQAHPHSTITKHLWALATLVERSVKDFKPQDYGINTLLIDGKEIEVMKIHEMVGPFCDLIHFAKATKKKGKKILVVAPLAGHHPTLLRDTIERLLVKHDVFVTGWKNARDVPVHHGGFDLDDYIDLLLSYYKHLQDDFYVMAVCQPTVPVVIATAITEQNKSPFLPRGIILMGGPIDPRINASLVNHFAKQHDLKWFEQHVMASVPSSFKGVGRQVCPGFVMLQGFTYIAFERHLQSYLGLYKNIANGNIRKTEAHIKFYDEYRSVIDLPAEFVLQTIDCVFQRYLLPLNQFYWKGQHADLKAIRNTPILTIEGELDNISPIGQTLAIHHLTPSLHSSMKFHHQQKNTGHYGIFSGHKWRQEIAPHVEDFIEACPSLNEENRIRSSLSGIGHPLERLSPANTDKLRSRVQLCTINAVEKATGRGFKTKSYPSRRKKNAM